MISHEILNVINWFILWYFIFLSLGYIILLASSMPDIFKRFKEVDVGNISSLMSSLTLPPVTVMIPAFNEEPNILETIDSVLKCKYPNILIVIINAGSTDNTLQKLIDTYQLEKVTPIIQDKVETIDTCRGYYISQSFNNITVIDKAQRDKSDALNMGINVCRTPLFITVDADTLVEPDAVSSIVFYMLSHPNAIAVGGAVYILNGCTFKNGQIIEEKLSLNPIYAFQTCDYLRSFLFNRSGWNNLGGALCYAGAFTLFKLQPVIDLGGYKRFNLSQDFEIITHLHARQRENRTPYQIRYTPSAAVWTDVPGTLKGYWRQRYNWQYHTLESLMPYLRMCFNPKYGVIGLFTYPFYLFGETLGAVVELMAYLSILLSWYLGVLDLMWTFLFFLVCWGFSIFLTMATTLMNCITFNKYGRLSDMWWILFYSSIEVLGFRQFNVICRVIATFDYFMDKLSFWRRKKIEGTV
jgi:cellulose synthase/poly-beta-1,6-N-acetylglucosamine synthase-like glycosyltransferase